MRFWNVLAFTIHVLPRAAADFHVGSARCTLSLPNTAAQEAEFGVIIPSNQDGCVGATSSYWGQGVQLGPGMTTSVCGAKITVLNNQTWRSSDGATGLCYPVAAITACSNKPYENCLYSDWVWCASSLCN